MVVTINEYLIADKQNNTGNKYWKKVILKKKTVHPFLMLHSHTPNKIFYIIKIGLNNLIFSIKYPSTPSTLVITT